MAKGSKSRIVIWTIVGILVVVAAGILIMRPKTDKHRPSINVERFTRGMESRFQKLEKKIAEAQAEFPGVPAEKWQNMSDRIAGGRQVLAEMAGITRQARLREKRVTVQEAYHMASKLLTDVTGKEVPVDSVDSIGGE